jgi:recombination protein RecA
MVMAKYKKEAEAPESPGAPEMHAHVTKILKSMGDKTGLQVMVGSEIVAIPRVSSGILSLDEALGGGYPVGRIVEIFGPESGGKTTVTLHAIAAAQAANHICAFIDVEHAYDPSYGAKLGVDPRYLIFGQPDSGEHALQQVEALISQLSAGDLVVVDSVANLTPQAELDGGMGDTHVGLQARLMSQALRKLTALVSKSGVILIFINQIRMKIGVTFGSPETTPGGNALKFYASIRLDVRKVGQLKEKGEDEEPLGNKVKVKVVKNKVAPPFRETELDLYYGYGFPRAADIFNTALKKGIITRNGSWYCYKGENMAQGSLNAKNVIGADLALMDTITKDILDAINAKP